MLDAGLNVLTQKYIKWLLRGQNLITLLHLMQMHKRRIEQSFYHYIALLFLSIDRIYEKLKGFWRFCTEKKFICLFFYLASNRNFWGRPDTIVVYCHSYALVLNHCGIFPYFCNGILLPKLFWPTVRKKCSSDQEKLLKFKAEGKFFEITRTIYSNIC